jgi:hypothetical protein
VSGGSSETPVCKRISHVPVNLGAAIGCCFFLNAAHILLCSFEGRMRRVNTGPSSSSVFGVNVTQLIKSTHQAEKIELTVSIARSFSQIRLARSQSVHVMTDALMTAAIDFEIELRNTILYHLSNVRSDFAQQLFSNASRNRSFSALPYRKNAKNASARRKRSSDATNHRH